MTFTGTGKTFASAFAVREQNPAKFLFIVHREQIAKQAMASYQRVFGPGKKFGLLSGNEKDFQADYLFSTMQMMAKPEIMEKFSREEFDCIVLDEAHKTGANSYQRIMEYFQPKLWLGMTASPERSDGFDVYGLFDHNIAAEIRLKQAMKEDLLCPFHYFGLTELSVDGQVFDENTGLRNFSYLVSEDRVNYIIENAKYYGYSGNRVKGLVFCSRKAEAKELSEKFNARGYRTEFLAGDDSQEYREECIARLSSDHREDYLEYIFTVDIFNEGVDIPEINQVIMLRPTDSPIIFIQQLGRGLRKAANKEFVVILDFIGNYSNNYMIPVALLDDRTYNKDAMRHFVMEGARILPGASTIHFDAISKTRIFESIDVANVSDVKLLKANYISLKNKLGRIPKLKEFDEYGEMDVCRIFDNKNLGSYYKFLTKYEKEYKIRLSEEEEKVIEFVSVKFASGKRIQELAFLKRMMTFGNGLLRGFEEELSSEYHRNLGEHGVNNIVNLMTNEFPSGASKKTYQNCILIEPVESLAETREYVMTPQFMSMLKNKNFYDILLEIIDFGISRYERDYRNRYQDTDFVLYKKYTYEDVCRLLNWEHNEVPLNIGGYKYDKITKTFPVFINYDKDENISDTIKYEDHFLDNSKLIAISKSGRSMESEDVQNFLHAKERGIDVHLFVRKNKDDKQSKEFYYLGRMTATGNAETFQMENTTKQAVEIEWKLDTPVRSDIYDYIVN